MSTSADHTKTAFVLTCGGSLGAVQVGMLRALAQAGIQPDLLIGTSAGAINAAWVATHGMSGASLTQLAELWSGLRRADVFPIEPLVVARGLFGRSAGVVSPTRLQHLVSAHLGGARFEELGVRLQVMATDLLTGSAVPLSTGSIATAVLASVAIPGVLPPVEVDGQVLVDGAVAREAGVVHAARLGASTVYVLPAGTACALPSPPQSAAGVALHALSVLLQHRVEAEMAALGSQALGSDTDAGFEAPVLRLLPPLCPMEVSPADFGHGADLVLRAHRAAMGWIAQGGLDVPAPERFLAAHTHHPRAQAAASPVCAPVGRDRQPA